jgi:hypothetical protein
MSSAGRLSISPSSMLCKVTCMLKTNYSDPELKRILGHISLKFARGRWLRLKRDVSKAFMSVVIMQFASFNLSIKMCIVQITVI